MKLFYSPGACSLAPHMALEEAGLRYDAVAVDLKAKKTEDGGDYRAINPKGAVPALQLDSGEVLTENAVLLQYISDQRPERGLLPANGMPRYRALEWLNYITTELHKGFGPLWNPATPEEMKQAAKQMLAKKFEYVAERLAGKPFLMGDEPTMPDIYLGVMLRWASYHGVEIGSLPSLLAFSERLQARPAIQRALRAEKLI